MYVCIVAYNLFLSHSASPSRSLSLSVYIYIYISLSLSLYIYIYNEVSVLGWRGFTIFFAALATSRSCNCCFLAAATLLYTATILTLPLQHSRALQLLYAATLLILPLQRS